MSNSKQYTRLTRKFLTNTSGNVAVVAAVSFIPLLLAAGTAMDYSTGVGVHNDLQISADGAALAAVASGEADEDKMTSIANNYFAANFGRLRPGIQAAVSVTFGEDTITVAPTAPVPTSFMSLAGIKSFKATASATATRNDGDPLCMLSLAPSGADGIEIQGAATFTANECAVQANSSHPAGLNGHSVQNAVAESFCVVGGYKSDNYSPMPKKKRRTAPASRIHLRICPGRPLVPAMKPICRSRQRPERSIPGPIAVGWTFSTARM